MAQMHSTPFPLTAPYISPAGCNWALRVLSKEIGSTYTIQGTKWFLSITWTLMRSSWLGSRWTGKRPRKLPMTLLPGGRTAFLGLASREQAKKCFLITGFVAGTTGLHRQNIAGVTTSSLCFMFLWSVISCFHIHSLHSADVYFVHSYVVFCQHQPNPPFSQVSWETNM